MTFFHFKKRLVQNTLQRKVLISLFRIAPPSDDENNLPLQSTWPSTRQIADINDISIYKARLVLLELVKLNMVVVSDNATKVSLRWYPRITESEIRFP